MKKLLLLLTAVCFISFSCSNSEKKKGPVIGVSMLSLQNEFIVKLSDAMQAKADELGIELIIVDAEHSPLKQVEQIESFIAQKVDAIIMNPCEVEGSSPAVTKALAANIPIININSETKTEPTAFVGSDDVESARIAMKYLVDKMGGKGNLLMIQGYMGQAAQLKREAGAMEVLQNFPEIKLLASQTAEWDRSQGMSLMENWIQSYGSQITAVFSHNDEMGLGAVKALQNAGMKDKVIVVSVDAIDDALQAVKKGDLDATVFQNAANQANGAVETALMIIQNKPFDKEVIIPFELVTQDNVANYLK